MATGKTRNRPYHNDRYNNIKIAFVPIPDPLLWWRRGILFFSFYKFVSPVLGWEAGILVPHSLQKSAPSGLSVPHSDISCYKPPFFYPYL
jgi:hypothetical protein